MNCQQRDRVFRRAGRERLISGGIAGIWFLLIFLCLTNPAQAAQDTPSGLLDSDKDGLENSLEARIGTSSEMFDTDGDGLSDYDEYCKYRTEPTKKDSDGDGSPDGDWDERREYTYTIRALCEIRPPSSPETINDLYQDARVVDKEPALEDGVVVELLIFPFATPYVYPQPYPRTSVADDLKPYVQPTVSMNFSPEMKKEIEKIVTDAATDVDAIEKMLQWFNSRTELIKYNPHWDFLHVVDGKIVWHKSLGSAEKDRMLLETNFFGDSMFKKRVHGTCSSTAILKGTMFRAAHLPTRLIQTLPLITRYTGDFEPLAERLRNRSMAKGYDWGPGTGGANHTYNELFLNNRWIRVDSSIGTGPFVGDRLFVKAWHAASWNNLKEEWNVKRCFRALDVSDAYAKHKSGFATVDMVVADKDLTITKGPDGRFRAQIRIYNRGSIPTPQFGVNFYAGKPDKGRRLLAEHRAGPIMPNGVWGESTRPFSLKEHESEIFAVIDPDNELDESSETDNKASRTISSTSPGPKCLKEADK